MDYGRLIEAALAVDTPESVTDAFDIVRELEMDGAVTVEGTGKHDHGTVVHNTHLCGSSSVGNHVADP